MCVYLCINTTQIYIGHRVSAGNRYPATGCRVYNIIYNNSNNNNNNNNNRNVWVSRYYRYVYNIKYIYVSLLLCTYTRNNRYFRIVAVGSSGGSGGCGGRCCAQNDRLRRVIAELISQRPRPANKTQYSHRHRPVESDWIRGIFDARVTVPR